MPNRTINIVKEPEEILKLLCIGINIPLWPEFHKYIIFDIKYFNAQSLVLAENNAPAGHALVFSSDKKILYFGFFGVLNDTKDRIEFLLEKLIEFATDKGFETLRGPVNIPTIIFGWGFMEEGSSTTLFAHKPVNSPLYPEIFRQKGFSEVLKEHSFEGVFSRVPPEFLEENINNDYELITFNSWKQIESIKIEFLELNARNLPPTSVVTPSSAGVFENYLEFCKQYGDPSVWVFTRFKNTNELIGCFTTTPNPFDKKSFVLLTIVLDKKHRSMGLGWLMADKLAANSLKKGINYCTTFVGTHVSSSREMSKKMGLPLLRTHTIFSYSLQNNA